MGVPQIAPARHLMIRPAEEDILRQVSALAGEADDDPDRLERELRYPGRVSWRHCLQVSTNCLSS